jgi:signal transduction histidine kinase
MLGQTIELKGFQHEYVLAATDSKKLVVRFTATTITFVVQKDGLVQVFTNLVAAVKKYNS